MSFPLRTSDRCQITRATVTTYKSRPAKCTLFGRKTGYSGKIFNTFFRVFSLFWDSFHRKPLPFKHERPSDPSKKNRAEKPTVGFCFFPACVTISARTMKNSSKFKGRSLRAFLPFVLVVESGRGCRAVVGGRHRRLAENPGPIQLDSTKKTEKVAKAARPSPVFRFKKYLFPCNGGNIKSRGVHAPSL
jgi:hypothetical protein